MVTAWVSQMCKIALHISLTFSLANHDHTQLKQNLNRCKGGHERLIKSYEKLRQEMQDLIAHGDVPLGAVVPSQLASNKLWDLDIDDDLWMDLTRDGQYQDDAPSWLYHQPMQQGIHTMLDLQRTEEEIERLEHECNVMFTWLLGLGKQLRLTSHMAQGIQTICLSCCYSDSNNHKAIPLFFTRSNCMAPTSIISVGLGI
jgi:hypothetical protein